MFKISAFVFLTVVACVFGKPGIVAPVAPVAYTAPVVSAPIVTATSSQVFTRNYNGLAAAPLLVAPVAYSAPVAYAAHAVAAPVAYTANHIAAPLAYTAGFAAAPIAARVATPVAAPLKYTAAGPVVL